jgi:hypothetical protein
MIRNQSIKTHGSAGAAVTLVATLSGCSIPLDAQLHAGAGGAEAFCAEQEEPDMSKARDILALGGIEA